MPPGCDFVYWGQPCNDDFGAGPLPFVERTSLRRLQWLHRLVSEFLPPAPAPRRAFFVDVSGFGKVGFGLSQRSRACTRRPSEAGHFYTRAARAHSG
jgi:hypothetical protein